MSGKPIKTSLKRASVLISALLILLMLAATVFMLMATRSLVDQYRMISGESVLEVYSHTLDDRLRSLTSYINSLMTGDANVRQLGTEQSARDRFNTRRGVSSVLSSLLQLEPLADGAMFWAGDDLVGVNSANSMETNEIIKAEMLRIAREENSLLVNSGWRWMEIAGQWYLVNISQSQSTCCAVWMRENTLSSLYPEEAIRDGRFLLFFRQAGQRIGQAPEEGDSGPARTLIQRTSDEGSFDYCCLVSGGAGNLTGLLMIITAVVLGYSILVTALIIILYQLISRMLREIQAGLVSRGEDLSHALPVARIKETDSVYQTLNDMSDKIRTLQANLYQHEINEQKSRVQVLHMQINSHFFRNCMNIIFSLAEVKNTRLIQDFCIYLIDYLNYINTAFQPSTPLREELVHLENYLTLQQMRYPGRVSWQIDADEEAQEFPILPLLLLTFVENVFKHGMIEGAVCVVRIQAVYQERNGQHGLFIRIEDNGSGISEEKAAALNAFDFSQASDIDFSNQKSGIEKTLARIQLFYGENATFHIGRNDQNRRTVIQLFFPQGKI